MHKKAFCLLLALLTAMLGLNARAMTRDELRAAYQELVSLRTDALPYAVVPDPMNFSAVGEISEEKLADALAGLNLIRAIAGVGEVELNPLYNLRCQNAALLLAANAAVSHNPPQPEGMHDDLYQSAAMGARESNLACLNWMGPDILIDAVEYFVRDDGEANLSALGHRRWLLSPAMAETGFGLASDADGLSYIAMYAVDDGNAASPWEYVTWPAAGAFPVELMRSELAWSITLNGAVYDPGASRPVVTLTETNSGASFRFDLNSRMGDGYCIFDPEPVGGGSCIIFRPNLAQAGIDEYVQNQVWELRVDGLRYSDGTPAEIFLRCEMASLYPQDAAAVELTQLEARLAIGETLQLHADVIPSYADQLKLRWISSDGSVAMVNAEGLVTALGEGSCNIIAESANGRRDICALSVTAG